MTHHIALPALGVLLVLAALLIGWYGYRAGTSAERRHDIRRRMSPGRAARRHDRNGDAR